LNWKEKEENIDVNMKSTQSPQTPQKSTRDLINFKNIPPSRS